MKIADFISKSIQQYPSLYKDVDYERSKLKVLNQIFFVNGNGLELANTKKPEEGGYVTEPKYKRDKKNHDWIPIKDKPYGKEKYKKLPADYFNTDVYYVYSSGNKPLDVIYRKERHGDRVLFRYEKTDNKFETPKLYVAKSEYGFSPYPISKGFCIASDIFYDEKFLQDDWMSELLLLCKRTLEYFNDENQYKENSYYPDENRAKSDLRQFEKTFSEKGAKGIAELRKIWCYRAGEDCPTVEEVIERKKDSWNEFHKEQIKFLTNFLKEYDKQKNLIHEQ